MTNKCTFGTCSGTQEKRSEYTLCKECRAALEIERDQGPWNIAVQSLSFLRAARKPLGKPVKVKITKGLCDISGIKLEIYSNPNARN